MHITGATPRSRGTPVPQSVAKNLDKLRERVMALRDGGGFSVINTSELIPTPRGRLAKGFTPGSTTPSAAPSPSWRISAKSPSKDGALLSGSVSPLPTPRGTPMLRSEDSAMHLTPRNRARSPSKTPASASRGVPAPGPRTPPRDNNQVRMPPPPNEHEGEGDVWDQQLNALNELTRKLTLTASQLPQEARTPERKAFSANSKPRRPDDWHKYHQLTVQLDAARKQLESVRAGKRSQRIDIDSPLDEER